MSKPVNDGPTGRRLYWLKRWEEGETGWHHQNINPHLRAFWGRVDVAPGSRVLVPLCGQSLDMAWLGELGYRVLGVEFSPLAIAGFFNDLGLEPEKIESDRFEKWHSGQFEILCGDIFHLIEQDIQNVSAVYDRASLVALEPEQRQRYAQLLGKILPDGCSVLLVAMDYPQTEMQGPPYSVAETEVRNLFEERFSVSLLHSIDLLAEGDRYTQRGLSRMSEQIYLLQYKEITLTTAEVS